MIVKGNSTKVDEYKFTAIVFTALYIVFELVALFNDTAGNEQYTDMMRNVIVFQQVGVGICVVIYDIIAAYKYFNYKKNDSLVYIINPTLEKIIETLCLVFGIIGFGVACFY